MVVVTRNVGQLLRYPLKRLKHGFLHLYNASSIRPIDLETFTARVMQACSLVYALWFIPSCRFLSCHKLMCVSWIMLKLNHNL